MRSNINSKIGVNEKAQVLNCIDDLFNAFSNKIDLTDEEWGAIAHLRETIKEDKVFFDFVFNSVFEQVLKLCVQYLMLAFKTDTALEILNENKYKNSTERKVN